MNTLERLKSLHEKATAGPFLVRKSLLSTGYEVHGENQLSVAWCGNMNDALLLAELRNALPKLLAFVDAWDDCQTVTANQCEKLSILLRARDALRN